MRQRTGQWRLQALGRACALALALLCAAPVLAEDWTLTVVDVDEAGTSRPAAGVDVEVLRVKPQPAVPMRGKAKGEDKPVGRRKLKTDAAGRIRFIAPAKGETLRARLPEGGETIEVSLTKSATEVGRYSRRLTLADLSVDLRANLEARDSGLRVWALYTLRATRPGVVRLRGEGALPLPLLAPRVRDVVLDRGTIPGAARHVEVELEGDGAVARERGALLLSGAIAPGRPLSVRVRYPIATDQSTARLGVRGVAAATRVAVAVVGARPARPRVTTDRPARFGAQAEGRERLAGFALLQPLRQGETAAIDVHDLPTPARWPRRALGGGFIALCLLAASALLRPTEP